MRIKNYALPVLVLVSLVAIGTVASMAATNTLCQHEATARHEKRQTLAERLEQAKHVAIAEWGETVLYLLPPDQFEKIVAMQAAAKQQSDELAEELDEQIAEGKTFKKDQVDTFNRKAREISKLGKLTLADVVFVGSDYIELRAPHQDIAVLYPLDRFDRIIIAKDPFGILESDKD